MESAKLWNPDVVGMAVLIVASVAMRDTYFVIGNLLLMIDDLL
ncbi:MAG: hypothetical protein ACYS6W_16175 [Planctomycetota bacterium]